MGKLIKQGAILLGISSLISRLLGIVREFLFSDIFGATGGVGVWNIDAYFAAFRLPDLLFNLLLYGTLSAAFVPIFSGYLRDKKNDEAWAFASNMLNILIIGLAGISVIIFIFAPQLLSIFYYGFDQEKLNLTVDLTRIMLISPILFGLSSFAQSVQTSFKNFFYYSLAPIFYNLSIIIAAFFFARENGVYAITYGVIIGAALHAAIQMPVLIKLGFRYKAIINTKAADIREMFRLVIPRIFGLAILQFNLIFDNFLASFLFSGSLGILSYSINLSSLPMGVVGVSLAVASFSTLAEFAHEKKHKEFKETLETSIRNILSLVIPASIGLIVLRYEIIGVILGGEAFTITDKIWTAGTLALFSIALFAQSTVPILARAFYAYKNTRTPVLISLFTFLINIIASLILVFIFDMSLFGLAAANSIAGILNFSLLYSKLSKKLGKFQDILKPSSHYIIGSLIMGLALVWVQELWEINLGTPIGLTNNAIFLGITIPLGTLIYFSYLRIMKSQVSFRKILK